MSYPEEDERQDSRPMVIRTSLVALEHMTRAPDDAPQLLRIYEKYPKLNDPNLEYGNIPTEKDLVSAKQDIRDVIDLQYGAGKRRHTLSDLADKRAAVVLAELKLNRSLRGQERREANSTTINQTQTLREEKRKPRIKIGPISI